MFKYAHAHNLFLDILETRGSVSSLHPFLLNFFTDKNWPQNAGVVPGQDMTNTMNGVLTEAQPNGLSLAPAMSL